MRFVASHPSITGIFRSMKIRSGGSRLHRVDRLGAVGGFDDLELADLPQPVDEDAAVVLVVLDDQNLLQHPFHLVSSDPGPDRRAARSVRKYADGPRNSQTGPLGSALTCRGASAWIAANARPHSLRAEPDGLSPHWRRADRPLQLALRPPSRWGVPASDRGHRSRSGRRPRRSTRSSTAALARARLGRGTVLSERARRPVSGRGTTACCATDSRTAAACTAEELEAKRNAALRPADRVPATIAPVASSTTPPPGRDASVIRFRMPLDGETVLDDLVKGRIVFQNGDLDDFVILRSDESATVQFLSSVVDDVDLAHHARHPRRRPRSPNTARADPALSGAGCRAAGASPTSP